MYFALGEMFSFAKIFTFFLITLAVKRQYFIERRTRQKNKIRIQGKTHSIPEVSFLVPFNFIEGSFITLQHATHISFWRTPSHSPILSRSLKLTAVCKFL